MIQSLWFSLLLLIPSISFATENISSFDEENISVLNDELRLLNNNTNAAASSVAALGGYFTGSILQTSHGGTSADLSACAKGSIPYFTSTGVMLCLAPSTSGYFLKTNGAGADPSYAAVSVVKFVNMANVTAHLASGSSTTSTTTTIDSSGDWTGKKFTIIGEICLKNDSSCTTNATRNFYSGSTSTFIGPFIYAQTNDVSGNTDAARSFISYDIFPTISATFGNGLSGTASCSINVVAGNIVLTSSRVASSDNVNIQNHCEVSGVIIREP